jgi:hypothetical protein
MEVNIGSALIDSRYVLDFLKILIFIILGFYLIFSLVVVQQVGLMAKTLITPVSPVVKAIAIINVGLALGFIVLAFGVL